MTFRNAAAAVALIATLTGCASHPRGFSPVMTHAPVDQAMFEVAFNVCSGEVASGRRASFRSGRGGSAAGGLAVGGVAAVATAGTAMAGTGLMASAAAAAGLTIGMAVFAPLAIYGVSRVQRANKEREIQTAMSTCLAEEGYVIDDWRVVRDEAGGMASPTRAAPVAEPSH